MSNLPTSLNNPGDLKYIGQDGAIPGTNGFAQFKDPVAGKTALLNDIQAKINAHPEWKLSDFAKVYAPPSENDTAQYTANLANKLGVSPVANIKDLQSKIGQFADAISSNEGYDNSGNLPGVGALGLAMKDSFKAPSQVAGDTSNPTPGQAPAAPPTMNATGSQVIPQQGGMLANIKKNVAELPGDVMKVANKVGKTIAPNEVDTLGGAMAGLGNIPAQEKGLISTPTLGGQVKGLGELGTVAATAMGTDATPAIAKGTATKAAEIAAAHPKLVGLLSQVAKKYGKGVLEGAGLGTIYGAYELLKGVLKE